MNNPIQAPKTEHVLSGAGLFAAIALLAGCATSHPTNAAAGSSQRDRAGSAKAGSVRYVEYTGSRIPVRVTGDLRASDLAVNMNVVDPNDPINKGDPTPLDSLARAPWASPGYRGY
jgi:hypothetical protein